MNVFTGWTGWAIFAVLLLGAALAAARHLTKRAYTRHHIRAAATRRRVNDTLTRHEQRMYDKLRLADQMPVRDGLQSIATRARISWSQRGTCHGGECYTWDPRGDRPVPVWCEKHCPDCRPTPDGSKVPCFVHDYAWKAEMERRFAE